MARTAQTKKLTELSIRAYLKPGGKQAPLHDGGGLYLRKRKTAALWYLRLTEPSTRAEQWHRLFPDDPAGTYPSKSLADARVEAERMWQIRSGGADPRAERLEQIAARDVAASSKAAQAAKNKSVRELFEMWAATELRHHVDGSGTSRGRKDNGDSIRQLFELRLLPHLADKPASEVNRADVMSILDAARVDGRMRTANMLLSEIRGMFRFAEIRELVTSNPAALILRRDAGGKKVERDRNLAEQEIAQLSKAMKAANMTVRAVTAVNLILATAVRVGELANARWEHIDLDRRVWKIPQENSKSRREHSIHLSTFARSQFLVLQALKQRGLDPGTLPWVWPNSPGTGPITSAALGKQLTDRQRKPARRIAGRSELTESLVLPGGRWTAHDLRRTASTLMARLGVSGDVIDECLNHKILSGARRPYIQDRRLEQQAAAFEALGARLQALTLFPQ